MPETQGTPARRHLIIAGTGRAGTTFLVRYLSAIGLDTHLTRRGDAAWLDDQAQAGLEDFPFGPASDDLPYVIKNPMLYEFIDQVIADPAIEIDGVLIPMRDLNEATESRVILERRSMYEHLPWLGYMEKPWESVGNVAGGLIHSLNATDEARLLAAGFHLLVERLVRANVPFVFLDFPRIVNDPDYLYEKLQPLVPTMPERGTANAIFAGIAEPAMVRVTSDRASPDERLDSIALRRELVRMREVLSGMTAERDAALQTLESTHTELVRTQEAYRAAESAIALAEQQRALFEPLMRETERLRSQVDDLERLRQRAWNDSVGLQAELDRVTMELQTLRPENEVLKSRTILLSTELAVAMSERAELEAHCHRLENAAAESRSRAILAERTVHHYLADFVDDAGALLSNVERRTALQTLRERNASLLAQLELTCRDLDETMLRLRSIDRSREKLSGFKRKLRATFSPG